MNFNKARANLNEIPEVVSVRKPPLKRKSAAATVTNARNDEPSDYPIAFTHPNRYNPAPFLIAGAWRVRRGLIWRTSVRRNLVAGNWKMNGDHAMATRLCADIARGVAEAGEANEAEVALCPPHILIAAAVGALAGSRISVGAQDLDANDDGAFTGQTSARMIADSGCRYVIAGHSERRTLYGESDELVARKTGAALAAGLRPIVCLGETLAEREAGVTEAVLGRQLDAVLAVSAAAGLEAAVVAYEPVWAIGTGVTATPDQAQHAHRFIRERLAAADGGERIAAECRILYGGSMKPENAADLLAQPDIDGGLVGGAALNAGDFLAICSAAGSA